MFGASGSRNVDVVKYLLRCGGDPTTVSKSKHTCFHEAARAGWGSLFIISFLNLFMITPFFLFFVFWFFFWLTETFFFSLPSSGQISSRIKNIKWLQIRNWMSKWNWYLDKKRCWMERVPLGDVLWIKKGSSLAAGEWAKEKDSRGRGRTKRSRKDCRNDKVEQGGTRVRGLRWWELWWIHAQGEIIIILLFTFSFFFLSFHRGLKLTTTHSTFSTLSTLYPILLTFAHSSYYVSSSLYLRRL